MAIQEDKSEIEVYVQGKIGFKYMQHIAFLRRKISVTTISQDKQNMFFALILRIKGILVFYINSYKNIRYWNIFDKKRMVILQWLQNKNIDI